MSIVTYNFAFTLSEIPLCNTAIPSQSATGILTVNTAIPIGTVANLGIVAMQISIHTGALVTDPSPTMLFDALDANNAFALLHFDNSTGELYGFASGFGWNLQEYINATGGDCAGSTPMLTLLDCAAVTLNGTAASARVAPIEGTFADGTYTLSGSTPAPGALQPSTPAGGGGTANVCRQVQCHPRLQTGCMGWGPLSISRDRTGVYAVYQDSSGSLQSWPLDQDADALNQIAAGIARCENAPARANNPGGLRILYGQLDRTGSLLLFPDFDTGNRALREAIMAALQPRKDEVL